MGDFFLKVAENYINTHIKQWIEKGTLHLVGFSFWVMGNFRKKCRIIIFLFLSDYFSTWSIVTWGTISELLIRTWEVLRKSTISWTKTLLHCQSFTLILIDRISWLVEWNLFIIICINTSYIILSILFTSYW